MNETSLQQIDCDKIIEDTNPMRQGINAPHLAELIESIKQLGLISPILVSPIGDRFNLIAGSRRLAAFRAMGALKIPAIVKETEYVNQVRLRFDENTIRQDPNPLEEALYLEKTMFNLQMNQKELAQFIRRSESYVSDRLAVLEFDDEITEAMLNSKISYSQARELSKVKLKATRQEMIKYVLFNGASPEQIRRWRMEVEGSLTPQEATALTPEELTARLPSMPVILRGICRICGAESDINKMLTISICPACREAAEII
jgi:ParB/RepB/Spo0J family partition protein